MAAVATHYDKRLRWKDVSKRNRSVLSFAPYFALQFYSNKLHNWASPFRENTSRILTLRDSIRKIYIHCYCLIWPSSLVLGHYCEQSKEPGNQPDTRRSQTSLIITSRVLHAQCLVQKYQGKVTRGNRAQPLEIYNHPSRLLSELIYHPAFLQPCTILDVAKHVSNPCWTVETHILIRVVQPLSRGNQTIPSVQQLNDARWVHIPSPCTWAGCTECQIAAPLRSGSGRTDCATLRCSRRPGWRSSANTLTSIALDQASPNMKIYAQEPGQATCRPPRCIHPL